VQNRVNKKPSLTIFVGRLEVGNKSNGRKRCFRESSNNCVKLIFSDAKHAENQAFASSAPLRETHLREHSLVFNFKLTSFHKNCQRTIKKAYYDVQ
jgi:hypothetical protein